MIIDRFLTVKCKVKILLYKAIYRKKISIPWDLSFRKNFSLMIRSEKDNALIVGNHCFFNNGCSINIHDEIQIGDFCIFGENVSIYDHDHGFRGDGPFNQQPLVADPIMIDDNCWIGTGCVILRGIHIGANSVVAANTVVTKDIPANSIVIDRQNLLIKDRIPKNIVQLG